MSPRKLLHTVKEGSMWPFVCVCVCVCEREREREREGNISLVLAFEYGYRICCVVPRQPLCENETKSMPNTLELLEPKDIKNLRGLPWWRSG